MESKEKDLLEVASLHQNLNNLLSCPICLDLMINPVRTKCSHVFCRSCIEDHIRKGKKAKVCPLCNFPKLTKRSLDDDKVTLELVNLFKELKQAEAEDTNNEVDFMKVRVNRVSSRESNGSPLRLAAGESKWTPVKTKPGRKSKNELWHQNKKGNVRTYAKPKPALTREPSMEFPGEQVDGDVSTSKEAAVLPLIEKKGTVEDWLKIDRRISGEMIDFSSQPDSVRGESTPQPSTSRVNDLSDFEKMSTPQTITPVQKKRKFFKTPGTRNFTELYASSERKKVESKRVSRGSAERKKVGKFESPAHVDDDFQTDTNEDIPTISQAVDINNTFDKLIAQGRKEIQKLEENPSNDQDKDYKVGLFFSQSDLDASMDILAPNVTTALIDSLGTQQVDENDLKENDNVLNKVNMGSESKSADDIENGLKIKTDDTKKANEVSTSSSERKYADADGWEGKSLSEMLEEGIKKKKIKAAKRKSNEASSVTVTTAADVHATPRIRPEPIVPVDNTEKFPIDGEGASKTDKLKKQPMDSQKTDISSFPSIISATQGKNTQEEERRSRGRRSFMLNVDTQELQMSAEPPDTLELIGNVAKMEDSPSQGGSTRSAKKSKLAKKKSPARKLRERECKTPNKRQSKIEENDSPSKNTRSSQNGSQKTEVATKKLSTPKTISNFALGSPHSNRSSRTLRSSPSVKASQDLAKGKKYNDNTNATQGSPKARRSLPIYVDQKRNDAVNVLSRQSTRPSQAFKMNSSQNKENTEFPIKKPQRFINKQGRVNFSILGRVRSTVNKPAREKIVQFIQLGLLTPVKSGLPSLQDLVQKRRFNNIQHYDHSTTGHHKVESWLNNVHDRVSVDESPRVKENRPMPSDRVGRTIENRLSQLFSVDNNTRRKNSEEAKGDHLNLLQRHLSEVDQDQIDQALNTVNPTDNAKDQVETEKPPMSQFDDLMEIPLDVYGLPDIDNTKKVDDQVGPPQGSQDSLGPVELPTPEDKGDFMTGLLGKNMSDVFSQDKETRSQELNRVALQEFLMETENCKLSQEDSNLSPSAMGTYTINSSSESCTKSKRRRINVIDSDDDSGEVCIDENKSPAKSKVDSPDMPMAMVRGSAGFESSFKDLNETVDIQDSQTSEDKKSRVRRRANKSRIPLVEVTEGNVTLPAGKKTSLSPRKIDSQAADNNVSDSVSLLSSQSPLKPVECDQTRNLEHSLQGDSFQKKAGDLDNKEINAATIELNRISKGSEGSDIDPSTQELQAQMDVAVGTVKLLQDNLHKSIAVFGSPNQTQTGNAILHEVNLKMANQQEHTVSQMNQVELKRKDTMDSDEDMFSATPDEATRVNTKKRAVPGLSTVRESIEEHGKSELEPEHALPEIEPEKEVPENQAENAVLPKVSQELEASRHQIPETEDIRLEEVEDVFKDASQISTLSEKNEELVSQVISSKKTPTSAVLNTSEWRFVLSNLTSQNRATVNTFISMFHCSGVSQNIDEQTTHVIVKTDEDLFAQRTLKYLQGVCGGLIVVSNLWCEKSVELGTIQDPLKYEVLDMELGGANGPYKARTAKLEGSKPVLTGWEILTMGKIPTISPESLEKMILNLGARNVKGTREFSDTPGTMKIVIVDAISEVTLKQARKLMKSLKLAVVDKEWLLETIGGWNVRELLPHAVEGVRADELVSCGYPSDIVGTLTE